MAIRPVDLQLVYLSGPQNAAQISHAQQAPQAAQQAAAAAFADELADRQETVAQTTEVEGSLIRSDADGSGNGRDYTPQRRDDRRDEAELSFSSDGEAHFIDVTA